MKAARKAVLFGGLLCSLYHAPQNFRKVLMIPENQIIDFKNFSDFLVHDITKLKIFNMTQNRDLANEIAFHLNTKVGKLRVYADTPGNDTFIEILENVRSKHIYIVCCLSNGQSINEALINLFLTISAAKRASAHKVAVILPYMPYSAHCDPRGIKRSMFMKDIVQMLEESGADKVITLNNYDDNSSGFFSKNLLDIDATRLCVSYYKNHKFNDLVLVSMDEKHFPNLVSIKEGFEDAGFKNVDMGYIAPTTESHIEYVGVDVKGRSVLLVDKLIDTGTVLSDAAENLSKMGAEAVYAFSVHGLIRSDSREKIENSKLKEVAITNTIPVDITNLSSKINYISVGKMLAEAIAQSCFNKPLEQLKRQGII